MRGVFSDSSGYYCVTLSLIVQPTSFMRLPFTLLKSLLLMILLASATPATRAAKHAPRLVSVSQTLAKMKNNSVYFNALVVAKMETLLDGPGGYPYPSFSVFAPTNAAFEKLKERGLADLFLKGQERKLRSVLSFSIVSDAKPLMTLHNSQLLHTMHGNTNLRVMQSGGHTWLAGGSADPVEVRGKPILCDNGAIYVIEEVLVPLARREVSAIK